MTAAWLVAIPGSGRTASSVSAPPWPWRESRERWRPLPPAGVSEQPEKSRKNKNVNVFFSKLGEAWILRRLSLDYPVLVKEALEQAKRNPTFFE